MSKWRTCGLDMGITSPHQVMPLPHTSVIAFRPPAWFATFLFLPELERREQRLQGHKGSQCQREITLLRIPSSPLLPTRRRRGDPSVSCVGERNEYPHRPLLMWAVNGGLRDFVQSPRYRSCVVFFLPLVLSSSEMRMSPLAEFR